MFLFFQVAVKYYYAYLYQYFIHSFTTITDVRVLTLASAKMYLAEFAVKSLLLSLPFLLVAATVAIFFHLAQTRMNFAFSRLKPDFSKINPIRGFKNLFSIRSVVELIKSIIKIVIVGAIIYSEIKGNFFGFGTMFDKSIIDSLTWTCKLIFDIVIKAGLYFLIFGILDYFYQWWDYERQIRMSFQDIKDEYKQSEGDPQVRGRIRERQRRMSMLRIAQKVPQADVVIKNPTHFAVAIKYNHEKDKAPRVIAKGQDYLALKIIEIAEANRITVSENPPLARGLYRSVALEQEIPEEYFQAVAEILVFVYSKTRKK